MLEISEYVALVAAAVVVVLAARPSYHIDRRIGFRLRRVSWGDAFVDLVSMERFWLITIGAICIAVAFALLKSPAVSPR